VPSRHRDVDTHLWKKAGGRPQLSWAWKKKPAGDLAHRLKKKKKTPLLCRADSPSVFELRPGKGDKGELKSSTRQTQMPNQTVDRSAIKKKKGKNIGDPPFLNLELDPEKKLPGFFPNSDPTQALARSLVLLSSRLLKKS